MAANNTSSLEINTDKEPFSIWGTLSGNNKPRIVRINQVYVEAVPNGHILLINNNDKPGLVGAIGTILAEANINIAGISLGREAQDGVAISVVNVDSAIPQATIDQLKNRKDVLFVKLLKV